MGAIRSRITSTLGWLISNTGFMLSNSIACTSGALRSWNRTAIDAVAVVFQKRYISFTTQPHRNLVCGSEHKQKQIYGTFRPRGMEATQTDEAKYQRETEGILPLDIVPWHIRATT
jgi:hypothetical protein